MSTQLIQPLDELERVATKAAVKAIQAGMHVPDVALQLRTLATKIEFAGILHLEVTGNDMSKLS